MSFYSHHAIWYKTVSAPFNATVVASLKSDNEVIELHYDALTIADARMVIEMAYRRPAHHDRCVIVITTQSINSEAQHALLKVLEEPPKTTQFVFFVPETAVVLPTVWSRVMVMSAADGIAQRESSDFDTFLRYDYKNRMTLIALWADKKDAVIWQQVVAGFDAWFNQCDKSQLHHLRVIADCRNRLMLRGASKKMLWEELAFSLPVITA
jgi:hypothetical protein